MNAFHNVLSDNTSVFTLFQFHVEVGTRTQEVAIGRPVHFQLNKHICP